MRRKLDENFRDSWRTNQLVPFSTQLTRTSISRSLDSFLFYSYANKRSMLLGTPTFTAATVSKKRHFNLYLCLSKIALLDERGKRERGSEEGDGEMRRKCGNICIRSDVQQTRIPTVARGILVSQVFAYTATFPSCTHTPCEMTDVLSK